MANVTTITTLTPEQAKAQAYQEKALLFARTRAQLAAGGSSEAQGKAMRDAAVGGTTAVISAVNAPAGAIVGAGLAALSALSDAMSEGRRQAMVAKFDRDVAQHFSVMDKLEAARAKPEWKAKNAIANAATAQVAAIAVAAKREEKKGKPGKAVDARDFLAMRKKQDAELNRLRRKTLEIVNKTAKLRASIRKIAAQHSRCLEALAKLGKAEKSLVRKAKAARAAAEAGNSRARVAYQQHMKQIGKLKRQRERLKRAAAPVRGVFVSPAGDARRGRFQSV